MFFAHWDVCQAQQLGKLDRFNGDIIIRVSLKRASVANNVPVSGPLSQS